MLPLFFILLFCFADYFFQLGYVAFQVFLLA
jgi:hypothetical protein